jgi:hypothetical protein
MNTKPKSQKTADKAAAPKDTVPEKNNRIVIEFPRTGFTDETLENLRKIVASKETLIKKALQVDNLPIDIEDDRLCFPWFTATGVAYEADTYLRFISAMCEMAKKQKRVTAKERDTQNEKYSMRLFLIRLGFIGPEFKEARKILLQNLTGNGSWKSGQRPEKAATSEESRDTTTAPTIEVATTTESSEVTPS